MAGIMDKSAQNKGQPTVKKVKKKQGKDEPDRLKQAEKKKRRLEKALATSAAICTELELKKLKKEEQQRLDEEGAAIAEAVALRVLVDEDSDELCDFALNTDNGYGPWIRDSHLDFPVAMRRASFTNQDCRRNSFEQVGWTPSTQQTGFECVGIAKGDWAFYPENYGSGIRVQLINNGGLATREISPGLIAAQAVPSLQIRDNRHMDRAFY